MRSRTPIALLLALLFASLAPLVPLAAAQPSLGPPPDTGTTVEPDVHAGSEECENCTGATLYVRQVVPGCYDCPALLVFAGAELEGTYPRTHHAVCVAAYASYCIDIVEQALERLPP